MNRRDFLQRAGLIAAGAVAADQLDLLDRLGWRRRFFPGWSRSAFDGAQDTTWLSFEAVPRPLEAGYWNRTAYVQVLDQYGRTLAMAPVVNGVASFEGITIPRQAPRHTFAPGSRVTLYGHD